MTIKAKPILLMRKRQQRLGPQRLQCLLGSTTASPRTGSSGGCHAICMGLGSLGTPWAFTGPMSWEASHSNVLLATENELSDMQPFSNLAFSIVFLFGKQWIFEEASLLVDCISPDHL